MSCACTARPCVHDRLPHVPRRVDLSVPEKRSVKEVLDWAASDAFRDPDAPRPSVSPVREVRER